MKEKNNKGLKITIVILAVLLTIAIGYICYDKDVFKLKNEPKVVENTKTEDESKKNIVINDEELNELLEMIPTGIYPIGKRSTYIDAYVNKPVTIKDINPYVLLNYALKDLAESDFSVDSKDKTHYLSFEKATEKVNKVYKNLDSNELIDISEIKTSNGSVILNKEFSFSEEDFGDLLYYDSEKPDRFILGTNQKGKGEVYKKLVSKKIDENGNLIVEQKIGALNRPIDIGEKYEVYTATNAQKPIYTTDSEEAAKKYFEDNQSSFTTYKEVFKKANDGKYYWYSSEPINE